MRLLALVLLAAPALAQVKTLLIVADDVSPPDLASTPTPNIDAVAAAGLVYTRHHGESACANSRAALMTGRFAYEHLIGSKFNKAVSDCSLDVSAADILPKLVQGRSVFIGKWHLAHEGDLTHPLTAGYDEWWGTLRNLNKESYFLWTEVHANGAGAETTLQTTYATLRQGRHALREVEAGTAFVHLAPHAAHKPFHWPPDELWSGVPVGDTVEEQQRRAMLEALDTVLGPIIESAHRRGYQVIFTADNGAQARKDKRELREYSLHVPLIVTGPGVPVGTSPALTSWRDVRSWIELGWSATSPAYQRHDRFTGVCEFDLPSWDRAVRDDRWKLIEDDGGASQEFYDLRADPRESTNLLPDLTPEQRRAYDRLLHELPR